jgi:hypothetical protein
MDYDLTELTPSVVLLAPNATTVVNTNGTGQDFKNYQGKVLVTLVCGNTAEITSSLLVVLQDSPNNANWTNTSGGSFTNIGPSSPQFQQIVVDTRAANRYLRAVGTIAGANTPNFTYGVIANAMAKYNPSGVNTATGTGT